MTVFPYQKDAKGNYFPIVSVSLEFETKKDLLALVDSGATVSIFKAEVAETLGIKIETGEEIYLGGVGGHIKGYLHRIKMEVGGKKFVCPIVFSREYFVSFNLLGREEVFKRFKITFEENRGQVRVE